jgi:hypothetical protein
MSPAHIVVNVNAKFIEAAQREKSNQIEVPTSILYGNLYATVYEEALEVCVEDEKVVAVVVS